MAANKENEIKTGDQLIASGPSNDTSRHQENLAKEESTSHADDIPVDLDAFEKAKETIPVEETSAKKQVPSTSSKEVPAVPKQQETPAKQEDFKPIPLEEQQPVESSSTPNIELDPAEQVFAKKMANDAREYFTARLKDLKEAKSKISELEQTTKALAAKQESSYLDHENGYLLDSGYAQLHQDATNVKQEVSFWEEQLIKIKNGDKWTNLQRDKNGNIQSAEYDPSAQAEVHVQQRINEGYQIHQRLSQEAKQLIEGFNSRRSERASRLQRIEDYMLPAFKDPKMVESDPVIKGTLKWLQAEGVAAVPPTTFAKLYAFTMKVLGENNQLRKGKSPSQAKEPNSNDLNLGNPTVSATSKDPDDMVFDESAFEKVKEMPHSW